MKAAARGEHQLLVPTIVLAELYYLNEKAGRPLNFAEELARLHATLQLTFVPLLAEHIADFQLDAEVWEMHDRIIVGVARRAGAACLTADRSIRNSKVVPVVW